LNKNPEFHFTATSVCVARARGGYAIVQCRVVLLCGGAVFIFVDLILGFT